MQAQQTFLPDVDIAKLRAELVERDAKLRDFAQVNAQLRTQIVELQKNVAFLTSELKRLLQVRHFGALDPNQGLLFAERGAATRQRPISQLAEKWLPDQGSKSTPGTQHLAHAHGAQGGTGVMPTSPLDSACGGARRRPRRGSSVA